MSQELDRGGARRRRRSAGRAASALACAAGLAGFGPAPAGAQVWYDPATEQEVYAPERGAAPYRSRVAPAPSRPAAPSPRRAPVAAPGDCPVAACSARFRSFRASDCTFQPYSGPRRRCVISGAPDGAETASAPAQASARIAPAAAGATEPPVIDEATAEPARAPQPAAAAVPAPGDSRAARRREAEEAELRASANVSSAGDSLTDWFDLSLILGFCGFCASALIRVWRGPAESRRTA